MTRNIGEDMEYTFYVTLKQIDKIQAIWQSTLGTNNENHAVSIIRTLRECVVTNEIGEVMRFIIQGEGQCG